MAIGVVGAMDVPIKEWPLNAIALVDEEVNTPM
jgi:hypothetical protein